MVEKGNYDMKPVKPLIASDFGLASRYRKPPR